MEDKIIAEDSLILMDIHLLYIPILKYTFIKVNLNTIKLCFSHISFAKTLLHGSE